MCVCVCVPVFVALLHDGLDGNLYCGVHSLPVAAAPQRRITTLRESLKRCCGFENSMWTPRLGPLQA